MSEPLFLQSVMQEKIWGGTKLRDVFGYEIPSDHVGEYWAISAHPNGVSTVKNGRFAGQKLDALYAEHRELFGNRLEPVFPLLTKILDANDWTKGSLVLLIAGMSLLQTKEQRLFMVTMPRARKSCASRLRARTGTVS